MMTDMDIIKMLLILIGDALPPDYRAISSSHYAIVPGTGTVSSNLAIIARPDLS
jgi:hypothetical protein